MLSLISCFSLSGGSDTIMKASSNAQHTKKAILFLREAGATISNSYQVSVINYHKKFDTTQVGNTFTVDNNHDETSLDSTSINFSWMTEDTLQIDYNKKLRTFIQQTNIEGVTVVYQPR